jgi:hypothetical protein
MPTPEVVGTAFRMLRDALSAPRRSPLSALSFGIQNIKRTNSFFVLSNGYQRVVCV